MKKYVLLLLLSFLSFSLAKEEISSLEKKFLSCNTIEGNFIQETYIKD
ncbi:MAG: hypothetical protein GXO21_06280, partial [Aquificae bacterium]|nr:hypothetical protein [Aquificota bacterium]